VSAIRSDDPGLEIALRLRKACEAHESELRPHLDGVAMYASSLARWMGLPNREVDAIRLAAPLHDVGKIGIPTEILCKPGSLKEQEMGLVRTHTLIGQRILAGSRWPVIQCAERIALSHHECWDGSGYPHGLEGEDIPLEARIVAVADVYEALISLRSYKPAWEEKRVIAELRELRGIKFEPRLVDVFLANLGSIRTETEAA